MASNANWAKMASTTGGTSTLTLEAVEGFPTFTEAFGTGETEINYVILGEGVREAGTGTYDGTALTLTRTPEETWEDGTGYDDSTPSALDLPEAVEVFCSPVHQKVRQVEDDVPLEDVTGLSDALADKADVEHDHDIDTLLSGIEGTRAAGKVVGVDGSGDTSWVDPTTAHGIADHTDVDDSGKNTGMAWVVDGEGKTVPAYLTAADISDLEEASNDEVRIAAGTKLRALPFAFTAADFAVPLLEMPADMYGEVTELILQPRVGSGDVDVTVKVDGTGVTSLVEVAATDSRQAIAATGNEAIAPGDVISIELSDTSGDVFIAGQVMVQIVDEPS